MDSNIRSLGPIKYIDFTRASLPFQLAVLRIVTGELRSIINYWLEYNGHS